MTEIPNKEAIDRLAEYFYRCSDKETLARSCAAGLVDLIRFLNIKYLDEEERKNLIKRTRKNHQSAIKLLSKPVEEWTPLEICGVNSDHENWREILKEHDTT